LASIPALFGHWRDLNLSSSLSPFGEGMGFERLKRGYIHFAIHSFLLYFFNYFFLISVFFLAVLEFELRASTLARHVLYHLT
jgi:hypothetical protein